APARPAFEQGLAGVDAATLPRSSHVNGLLDHPMSAGFLGGLNLAARGVTGRDIDLYVSDPRDPAAASIAPAARALQTELRTRYLNPRWLAEMKAHGYDGARQLMFMTDHLDLWDSTASDMVNSRDWAEVKAVYVDDELGLDLDQFFERYNPHAQQVLMANLLGAASRGHWHASAKDLADVARRLAESTAAHGAVCEATVCRNEALTKLVDRSLANVPGGAQLTAKYRAAIDRATTVTAADPAPTATAASRPNAAPKPRSVGNAAPNKAPVSRRAGKPAGAATAPIVTGRVLENKTTSPSDDSPPAVPRALWWTLTAFAVALFAAGWKRGGRAR
ncbi:MAG: cobaltochelatase subunit CobN, partial [Vicinamibacteraceae bacterium]